MVAGLAVDPVGIIEGSVRPLHHSHTHGIVVIAEEEVGPMSREVARAIMTEILPDDAMSVQVVKIHLPTKLFRKLRGVVVDQAAVGVSAAKSGSVLGSPITVFSNFLPGSGVVGVVGDRLDVVERERVEVLASLSLITASVTEVIEVRDDARTDEKVPVFIEVDTPWIARTMGVDLELL